MRLLRLCTAVLTITTLATSALFGQQSDQSDQKTEEYEESTQGQQQSATTAEHATSDTDKPLTEETKTANAEDVDEAPANAASLQATPAGQNIDTGQPVNPSHKGGAAAPGAGLAEKATDPSAILTQLTNYFWTENTSDDRGIANTYVFQPVLPLTGSNVMRPTLPVLTIGGPVTDDENSGVTGLGDLTVLDFYIGHLSKASWGVRPAITSVGATLAGPTRQPQ
jgi:hypothetical protein